MRTNDHFRMHALHLNFCGPWLVSQFKTSHLLSVDLSQPEIICMRVKIPQVKILILFDPVKFHGLFVTENMPELHHICNLMKDELARDQSD